MVALYTGARLQDVANMRWESVDLQNKWISFRVGQDEREGQDEGANQAADARGAS